MNHKMRFALTCSMKHLMISILIGIASATLVFLLWYPHPYNEMLGVENILFLILIVDIVCGPLITLIIANPLKSKKEMISDFSIIGIIQAIALIYGLHATWMGRPVVLAFENDRFTVVAYNEIEHSQLSNARQIFQRLPNFGMILVATRQPSNNEEFLRSLDMSLVGITPAMRPNWWEPIEDHAERIKTHIKPLRELKDRRPRDINLLNQIIKKNGGESVDLYYLPLTSTKNSDWIAILNKNMNIVGYAPVDGF